MSVGFAAGLFPMKRFSSPLVRLLLCSFWTLSSCFGQSSDETQTAERAWLTGNALSDQLNRPRSMTLKGVPLLSVLNDLQNSLPYAIVLDHRIDPDQPVTLATGMVPTSEAIRQIAAHAACAVSFSERFAFIGPESSAGRLRTVIQIRQAEIRAMRSRLGDDRLRRIFEEQGNGWPQLTQPASFVAQQLKDLDLPLKKGLEIPFDLWRKQRLPKTDVVERLMLILVQYDLTFQVDDDLQISFCPLEDRPAVKRRFLVPANRRDAVMEVVGRDSGESRVTWAGNRVTIEGRVEFLDAVKATVEGRDVKVATQPLTAQLFTMTIPRGTSVNQVIESLKDSGLIVEIEAGSADDERLYRRQKVQLEASQMPGAKFFPALLQVGGAEVLVQSDRIVIRLW